MSVRPRYPMWVFVLLALLAFAVVVCLAGCVPRAYPDGYQPSNNPVVQVGNAEAELQHLFTWAVAVGLFGVSACIAATVFLASIIPALAKWSIAGAMGFGALLILAIFFKVTLPFLPWIGLGLLGVGICLGIWYLRNHPEIFRLKSQLALNSSTVPK